METPPETGGVFIVKCAYLKNTDWRKGIVSSIQLIRQFIFMAATSFSRRF